MDGTVLWNYGTPMLLLVQAIWCAATLATATLFPMATLLRSRLTT